MTEARFSWIPYITLHEFWVYPVWLGKQTLFSALHKCQTLFLPILLDETFSSLGQFPQTDQNSAEYSRKPFEELQVSLYIYRSLLSGIPSCELYLPWSFWTFSSLFSTQGGYGLYLIPLSPLPVLQRENSKAIRWDNRRAHLISFPSLEITVIHCLMSGAFNCCLLYFIYSWLLQVGR